MVRIPTRLGKTLVLALALMLVTSALPLGALSLTGTASADAGAEDTYFVRGDGQSLLQVEYETGNVVWNYSNVDVYDFVVEEGYVYVATGNANLQKVNIGEDTPEWTVDTTTTSTIRGIGVGESVIGLSHYDGSASSIDPSTGQLNWHVTGVHTDDGTVHSSEGSGAAVIGEYVYSAGRDGKVAKLDFNGNIVDSIELDDYSGNADLAVKRMVDDGEALYVSSFESQNHLFRVKPDMSVTWESTVTAQKDIKVSPSGDYILAGGTDGLHKLSVTDGSTVWSQTSGIQRASSFGMASDGESIIVGDSYSHELYDIDFTDGSVIETNNYSSSYYYLDTEPVSLSEPISFTVVDQNGDSVRNATAEVFAVDHSKITPDAGQSLEQRAQELMNRASEVTPKQYYDPTLDLQTKFDAADSYVAIHTKNDWGLNGWADQPDLGKPTYKLDANTEYVFSVWDASEGSSFTNRAIDGDLPGGTSDGPIVIEQIDAGKDVTDTLVLNTTESMSSGFGPFEKEHHYATAALPQGFYHVYPQDNPAAGYFVSVDGEKVVQGWVTGMTTQAGALTSQAEWVQEQLDSGVFQRYAVQTDANGQATIEVGSQYKTIGIVGYKAGSTLDDVTDPSPVKMYDLVEQQDFNGSIYITKKPTYVSPPASDVMVETIELSAPAFLGLDQAQLRWENLQNLLTNESYTDVMGDWLVTDPANATEQVKNQTEQRRDDLVSAIEQNEEMYERALDELDATRGDLEDSQASVEELREQIDTLESLIRNGPQNVTVGDGDIETDLEDGEGLANLRIPIGTGIGNADLVKDGITVMATHSDGTQTVVPSEYVSLESSLTSDDQYIVVEDYPLPQDAASTQFAVTAVTAEGAGSATTGVVNNPASDGEMPELDSINANTLRPAAGEQVSLTFAGADSTFGSVEDVTVYDANGDTVTANVSGDTATFVPTQTGRHIVEYTLSDSAGRTYVDRLTLGAYDTGYEMNPSVRIVDSLSGLYVLTGDGVAGGEVDQTSTGGLSVGVRVEEETTRPVHVYTHDVASLTDMSVQMMDERGQALDAHRSVVIHVPTVGEDTLLRRNDNPLSDTQGTLTTTGKATTIDTYTDSRGRVSLNINSNPDFLDRIDYRVDELVQSVDLNFGF